jgi:hypothetical protein
MIKITNKEAKMKKEFAKYCKLIVDNPRFTEKDVEFEYDSAYLDYTTENFMLFVVENKLKVHEISKLIEELRYCYVPYKYIEDGYAYIGEIEAEFREIDEYY